MMRALKCGNAWVDRPLVGPRKVAFAPQNICGDGVFWGYKRPCADFPKRLDFLPWGFSGGFRLPCRG